MSTKRKKNQKKSPSTISNHNRSQAHGAQEKKPGNFRIQCVYNCDYFDVPLKPNALEVADAALQTAIELPLFSSFSKVTPLSELAKFTSTNILDIENPRDSFISSITNYLADRFYHAVNISTVIPYKNSLDDLETQFSAVLNKIIEMSDSELSYLRTFLIDGMVLTEAISAATGLAILDQREEVNA